MTTFCLPPPLTFWSFSEGAIAVRLVLLCCETSHTFVASWRSAARQEMELTIFFCSGDNDLYFIYLCLNTGKGTEPRQYSLTLWELYTGNFTGDTAARTSSHPCTLRRCWQLLSILHRSSALNTSGCWVLGQHSGLHAYMVCWIWCKISMTGKPGLPEQS